MGKDNFMGGSFGGVRGDNHGDLDRDQGGNDDMGVKQDIAKLYHGDDDSEGGLISEE